MKHIIYLITSILSFTFLFSSCTKEEVKPILEIYITAKPSSEYKRMEMAHGAIRFKEDRDGTGEAISSLQEHPGFNVDLDLTNGGETIVAGNQKHWSTVIVGVQSLLGKVKLYKNNDETLDLLTHITSGRNFVEQDVTLENGKIYIVEFIYDIDESVQTIGGDLVFEPVLEVNISEK